MRWDVFAWAAIALLLFAAEALAPGAFMLWLGFAAVAVFLAVLLVPGIPVLAQAAAFIALGFVSIQVYRKWFRARERQSVHGAFQWKINPRTTATAQYLGMGYQGRNAVNYAFSNVGSAGLSITACTSAFTSAIAF